MCAWENCPNSSWKLSGWCCDHFPHWDSVFFFFNISQPQSAVCNLPSKVNRNWFWTSQQATYLFFFFFKPNIQHFLFLLTFHPSFLLFIFSLLLLFSVNLHEISEVGLYFPDSYYTSMCGFLKVFLSLRCCFSWAEAAVYQECSLECATSGNYSFHKPSSSFSDNQKMSCK